MFPFGAGPSGIMSPETLIALAALSSGQGFGPNAGVGGPQIPNPGGVDGAPGGLGLSGYTPPPNTNNIPTNGGIPDWLRYGLPPDTSLGSEGGLWAAENGNYIGQAIGALTGVPGLGQLGRFLGNQYIDNNVFMTPSFGRSGTDDMIDRYLYGFAPQQSPLFGDPGAGMGPSYGPGMRPVQSGAGDKAGGIPGSIAWRRRKK